MKAKQSSNGLITRRFKEGGIIFGAALAVFLFVALFSYNSTDPSWSHAASAHAVANSAGRVGAWCADVLLYFFGYVAYLLPILLSIMVLQPRLRFMWVLHVLGFAAVVLSSCALIDMVTQTKIYGDLPGPTGGVCGNLLKHWLVPHLSFFGCYTMFLAMFMIGITIGTGVSWLRILEIFGQAAIALSRWFVQGCQLLLTIGGVLLKLCRLAYRAYNARTSRNLSSKIEPQLSVKPEPKLELVKPKNPAIHTPAAVLPLHKQDQLPLKTPPTNNAKKTSVKFPDLDLLDPVNKTDARKHYSTTELENLAREVEEHLRDFGIEVKVVAICPGPIITRFEMTLAPGMKASKITGLAKDLARSLSVNSVRVVEVIPGKSVVGLEIPNRHRETVKLREVLEADQYQQKEGVLNLALGRDIAGVPVVVNLANMPHLLVAGTTGSGKSVAVNAMLLSLLFKASPEELRLILIDPKMLELSIYDGISHLLTPVVTDMNDAANALRWCVAEMERRYQIMAALGVRNLAGYNAKINDALKTGKPILDPLWDRNVSDKPAALTKFPYIVVIIDEFADMMMVVGKKVEELIARIAQKARAAGIHMLLATQRPSVDVITGLIKANVPTRIAFQVSSRIDSRTILDQQGAEQLLGYGDMLYLAPGAGIPVRVHGAFVSDQEVHNVVNAIKQHLPPPVYINEISTATSIPGIDPIIESGEQDPMYDEAVAIVMESRKASISYLQRRLKIGYNRSARLIEAMEAAGLVTEMLPNGTREVKV